MYNIIFLFVEIKCPVLNAPILHTYHGFIFPFLNISHSDIWTCLLRLKKLTTKNIVNCIQSIVIFQDFQCFGHVFPLKIFFLYYSN